MYSKPTTSALYKCHEWCTYATLKLLMGQRELRLRTQKLINDEKSLVVKIA